MYGNAGYLPYTEDMDESMGMLRALIASVNAGQPRSQDMGAVGDYARAGAARRGIKGPLAQRMVNSARNDFMLGFDAKRTGDLQNLFALQNRLGSDMASREMQIRKDRAMQDALYKQNIARRNKALLQMGGTILGGAIGGIPTGGAGLLPGAAIGGAAGTGLGELFFPEY